MAKKKNPVPNTPPSLTGLKPRRSISSNDERPNIPVSRELINLLRAFSDKHNVTMVSIVDVSVREWLASHS